MNRFQIALLLMFINGFVCGGVFAWSVIEAEALAAQSRGGTAVVSIGGEGR